MGAGKEEGWGGKEGAGAAGAGGKEAAAVAFASPIPTFPNALATSSTLAGDVRRFTLPLGVAFVGVVSALPSENWNAGAAGPAKGSAGEGGAARAAARAAGGGSGVAGSENSKAGGGFVGDGPNVNLGSPPCACTCAWGFG
jgi:hypothetical protein